jgi:hypothetical protein
MATELTPDDAVQAIRALTRVLETLAQDLRAFTVRSDAWTQRAEAWTRRAERWMRWHFWVLGLILLSSVGMFVLGARTHAAQNEALRQVMQENRAIFERLPR